MNIDVSCVCLNFYLSHELACVYLLMNYVVHFKYAMFVKS